MKRRTTRELFVSKIGDKSGEKMMKKQKWNSFKLKKYLFIQTWCALFAAKTMNKNTEKGTLGSQRSYEMTTLAGEKVEK